MHKFNTLKYGGGAVTLLSQHVAQRMVRHVSKRNGWNGVGRFGEEVQDNEQSIWRWHRVSGVCCSGRICSTKRVGHSASGYRKQRHSDSYRTNVKKHNESSSRKGSGNIFYHACGERNHLLTGVGV